MDSNLVELINNEMPRFNESITSGFHLKEFKNAKQWYTSQLKLIYKSLESRGVYFMGIEDVTPEELLFPPRNKDKKDTQPKEFSIHKESLYPVKILFDFVDKHGTRTSLKPKITYLGFTDKYGDMWIRGTKYSLQIVLSDRGISVTNKNKIFVRVLGFKFKIGADSFTFGQVETKSHFHNSFPINLNLASSRIYAASGTRQVDPGKTPTPLLAWYVFAVYGFSEAMKRFGECEYVIDNVDVLSEKYGDDPEWTIYRSLGTPLKRSITRFIDLEVAIALRPLSKSREGVLPTLATQYAAALLMVTVVASGYFDLNQIDNKDFWMLIIGRCSVKGDEADHTILKYMYDHFDSLSDPSYRDSVRRFSSQAIAMDDMYAFFNHIITNRTEIIRTTDKATALNKGLSSLDYTLESLIRSAHGFKHEVKNTSELTVNKLDGFLTKHFRQRDIENARKGSNLIQEDAPTDNPFADYVLGTITQASTFASNSKKPKPKPSFNPNDASVVTHPSLPFGYSYLRMTKPGPDGRSFLNPCVSLIDGKYITIEPRLLPLYEHIQRRLTVAVPINKKDSKNGKNTNKQ